MMNNYDCYKIGTDRPLPYRFPEWVIGWRNWATHVLAVMTPATAASRWVPYEYGRVKDRRLTSTTAACWVHAAAHGSLPEYQQLGPMAASDDEVRQYFQDEFHGWSNGGRKSMPRWSDPIPPPLP